MRPEGWEGIVQLEMNRYAQSTGDPSVELKRTIETLADAVLEALRELGKDCDPMNCKGSDGYDCISCIDYLTMRRKGTLVFMAESTT
jgi:hypothetical protein